MKKDITIPRLFYKKDILGFILIIFVVAVMLLIKYLPDDYDSKKYAEITIDSNVALKMELSEDMEYSSIPIENGFDTVVAAEGGEVWIESSACKDKVCVHSGKISNKGASVVCLPSKTVVRIVGETDEADTDSTDAVTY